MKEGEEPRIDDAGLSANLSPGLEEFRSLSGEFDLAVLTADLPCDVETPISAFIKLRGSEPCFLLESAERGETWGRYSILGFRPYKLARSEGGRLLVASGQSEKEIPGDPVRNVFQQVESDTVFIPNEQIPFSGGAVGYFGYDLMPFMDKVTLAGTPTGLAEMMFMFPRQILVFDHFRSRIYVGVVTEVPQSAEDCRREYELSVQEIRDFVEKLSAPLSNGLGGAPGKLTGEGDFASVESNMSREKFEGIVEKAREYILEGEAFQIVAAQKFSVPFAGDPLSIYRFLRSENPSPYMFYLKLPSMSLVGSSPEPMVTQRGGRAVIRPIAGTRPRGSDDEEDARLEKELLADPKEKAEHIMLVDLARNDLGRVCRAGTVRVTSLLEVERYSHVMHLVSEVEGTLKQGMGNYELLKASFPAGTVTGAPKIRACQIIDELEGERRGPYAGAVGYLSYSGDMDTCITIRTVVIEDSRACVQAGAGIVADSVPSNEYNETKNKARALIRAVRAAGGGAP